MAAAAVGVAAAAADFSQSRDANPAGDKEAAGEGADIMGACTKGLLLLLLSK